MAKIKKKDIGTLLGQWRQDYNIFVPADEGGRTAFLPWDGKADPLPEKYRNTVIPPKQGFLPNMEKLFDFAKEGGSYHLEPPAPEKQPRLIFGIRPCDARAAAIIDLVFKDTYEDTYYLGRRANTLLVGLGCTNPYDSCFCTSLGLGPMEAGDVDLMLVDIGDEYLIEEITDRGRKLMAAAKNTEKSDKDDEVKAGEARETAAKKITRKIDAEKVCKNLAASFDNEAFWQKIAAKCVSCGVCTFLCPTCYCFDINDEKDARYRNWDCCSFPLYTEMPAENPREEKWRRVRQKVCHKYTFYPALWGVIACTGCGRCIRQCPVNWDITQTLEAAPGHAGTEKK